ncbi:hypothetical protein [Fusobacterium perfoetens]|nr:hypothetical protein [Fusobacterium perfoetens]
MISKIKTERIEIPDIKVPNIKVEVPKINVEIPKILDVEEKENK